MSNACKRPSITRWRPRPALPTPTHTVPSGDAASAMIPPIPAFPANPGSRRSCWRASRPAHKQCVAANPLNHGPVAIGRERHGVERWNAVGRTHALQASSQHATKSCPFLFCVALETEPQRPFAVFGESPSWPLTVPVAKVLSVCSFQRLREPTALIRHGPIAGRLEAKHFRGSATAGRCRASTARSGRTSNCTMPSAVPILRCSHQASERLSLGCC